MAFEIEINDPQAFVPNLFYEFFLRRAPASVATICNFRQILVDSYFDEYLIQLFLFIERHPEELVVKGQGFSHHYGRLKPFLSLIVEKHTKI